MQTSCSIAKAFHNSCSTTLVWDEITFCHKNSKCDVTEARYHSENQELELVLIL